MPVYEYQGQHYELADGLSNEQALAKIKAHVSKSSGGLPESEKKALKAQGNSFVGGLETGLSMLTGGLAQPIAGWAGLLGGGAEGVKKVQDALTYQPRGEVGKKYTQNIGEALHMPIEAMGKVGEYVGGNAGRTIAEAGTEIAMNFLPLGAVAKGLKGKPKARTFDPGVPKAAAKPDVPAMPEQLELPLETSAQSVAEMRSRAQGQRDMFGPTNEPLVKGVPETSPIERPSPIETVAQNELFDQPEQGRVANPYEASIGEWRIDENGMPIRADLSMEAVNLENPLQRNLWGDELDPRVDPIGQSADLFDSQRQFQEQPVQGGVPLTQAMDSMPPDTMRAAVEETGMGRELPASPELEAAKMAGEGMRVPQSQRGAIDTTILDGIFKKEGEPGLKRIYSMLYDKYVDSKYDENLRAEMNQVMQKIVDEDIRAKRVEGLQRQELQEVFPGFVNIPSGTKITATHGLKYKEPTQGTVVGTKQMRFDDGPYSLPVVDFGDGQPRTVLPSDIKEVFAPRPIVPKNQRGAIDFGDPAKKQKILDIVGTKQFATIPVPSETIKQALAAGKDGSGSINFSAGGSLEAAKRASPLIREGSRVVQGFKNRAENRVRETVIPVEKQLRSLSKTEVEDLASVFKAEMFADAKFTMQELADKGLTEKQLIAYQKTRDMFDAALKEQNRVRELQGRKPISAKEAYLSSRWQGDFRRAILNKEGKLVWYLAADNKWALDAQEKALIKEFPDQYGSSVDSVVRSSRKGIEANDVYSTVLDVLGRDDPAVAKIAAWMEAQTIIDSRKALGQEKHFEPKSNIRGFVGDRPGANPTKEAFAMFQQQINYAKNAHNWTAMQEAGLNLKEVFTNPDLAAQQPKNMAYLKEYFADQLGFNENQVIKSFEDQIRKYGVSPNQIGRAGTNIKAIWVMQKLAVNAGFIASNVIQAGNILPHLTDLQVKYGGNPVSALANGMTFGPAMAIAHIAGKDKSFIKTLSNVPGYSPFIAKAMKYAEDNSIVSRTLADESPIEASFGAMNAAKRIGNASINMPESVLRATTYMTYVEQLRSSGKFKGNDLELFRVAEERTNISMGDYRAGEKAPIFNKLGQLGDSLNVLTTFPINYYNQWSWAAREAGRKNPLPALTMLGVQGYMAGLMGVPGFAEADKAIEFMKEWLSKADPLAWKKIKDFNLKQIALDNGGESVLYGGLSTQSKSWDWTGGNGIGMTSRAAAPVPSEMIQTPAAPFIDIGKQALSVGSAVASTDDSQKWAQAAYNVMPSGLQGALETRPLRDFTSVQRGDKRVYGKPTDMASRTGMYARTPEEEFLRSIGLRSQKEVVTRDRTYASQKQAAVGADVMRELPNKIYNQLRNNNQEKAKDFITLYVELSGKELSAEQIETQLMQEFTTVDEKLALRKNSTAEQLLAVKRLRDTLQQMGYK